MYYHPKLAYWYALFALGELSIIAVIKMVEHFNETRRKRHAKKLRPTLRSCALRKVKRGQAVYYGLSQLGRDRLLGGRDPEAAWNRTWNRKWRFFYFDLPVINPRLRGRLWRWLRKNHFGYFQKSIWIHPDHRCRFTPLCHRQPSRRLHAVINSERVSRATNGFLVHSWDFDLINRRYQAYIQRAEQLVRRLEGRDRFSGEIRNWLAAELKTWLAAVTIDPLLPRTLWPRGYLGERAWRTRQRVLAAVRDIAAHY